VGHRGPARGAAQDALEREHPARVIEVGRAEVTRSSRPATSAAARRASGARRAAPGAPPCAAATAGPAGVRAIVHGAADDAPRATPRCDLLATSV